MGTFDYLLQQLDKLIHKKKQFDYKPLVYHEQTSKVFDSWVNQVANIGSNNALMQYNEFILKRLDYRQCAAMSLDTLINKSIMALSYDMVSHGYDLTIECENKDLAIDIKDKLNERIKHYDLDNIIQNLIVTSLRFGGALLYIDINSRYELPISNDFECASLNQLSGFCVIEPDNVSASKVNTNMPIYKNYMNPSEWFIGGVGAVNSTRLLPLIFFEIPSLIKPLFNYLGISLTQLMQDYTQNAETIRNALSELMLRFKTDYIKTTSENISSEEYLGRIKYNNATKNNFSTLLLSENEELQTLTTSVAGLDNITSQCYELVVAASGIPATRLMGISPRGFNATGESDLIHYYELISQYQSKVKPLMIECIKKILAFDLKIFDKITIDIRFNAIGYRTEKDKIEAYNLKADYFSKLTQSGIISEAEAGKAIQDNDLDLINIDFDNKGYETEYE